MERRSSNGQHEASSADAAASAKRRKHLSVPQDIFRRYLMTASPRRSSYSPSYTASSSPPSAVNCSTDEVEGHESIMVQGPGEGGDKSQAPTGGHSILSGTSSHGTSAAASDDSGYATTDESLPSYSTAIAIEGVFHKKNEMENATKRAEDRRWQTVFVTLNGTALQIYSIKKVRAWGKSRAGSSICQDNPPWVSKAKLRKTYSLLHADAGIAADYKKRRYVIRIRAEADQFLLSCIELSTFIKWLECLFAAIAVAAPIDDRDFPRDMSIPRIQRLQWMRSQARAAEAAAATQPEPSASQETETETEASAAQTPLPNETQPAPTPAPARPLALPEQGSQAPIGQAVPSARPDHAELMITTSNPNPAIDPQTGKWVPEHRWTTAHDLLYAKLCYSNLLFGSPRKSNFIISKGKQWTVDWETGKMVRVLPPAYGETELLLGPWQVKCPRE